MWGRHFDGAQPHYKNHIRMTDAFLLRPPPLLHSQNLEGSAHLSINILEVSSSLLSKAPMIVWTQFRQHRTRYQYTDPWVGTSSGRAKMAIISISAWEYPMERLLAYELQGWHRAWCTTEWLQGKGEGMYQRFSIRFPFQWDVFRLMPREWRWERADVSERLYPVLRLPCALACSSLAVWPCDWGSKCSSPHYRRNKNSFSTNCTWFLESCRIEWKTRNMTWKPCKVSTFLLKIRGDGCPEYYLLWFPDLTCLIFSTITIRVQ